MRNKPEDITNMLRVEEGTEMEKRAWGSSVIKAPENKMEENIGYLKNKPNLKAKNTLQSM